MTNKISSTFFFQSKSLHKIFLIFLLFSLFSFLRWAIIVSVQAKFTKPDFILSLYKAFDRNIDEIDIGQQGTASIWSGALNILLFLSLYVTPLSLGWQSRVCT